MSNWDFGGAGSGDEASGFDPPPAITPTTGDRWDTTRGPGSAGVSDAASGPSVWLAAGLVITLAAIGLHVALGGVTTAWVTWVMAGPLAIGLLGVYTAVDTRRRSNPWYAESELLGWARRVLVVLSLVGVGLSAWTIADWFAR